MSAVTVVPRARPAARRATTTSRAARPAPVRTPVRTPVRHPKAPRARLRLVDTAAVRRKRRVRIGLWLLTLFVSGSLVAVVAFHVVVAQGQLEIDRIERQTQLQQERYQELRSLVAQQSAPEEIVRRAGEMGLVEASGPVTPVPALSDPATPASSSAPSTTKGWETVKPHLEDNP